MSSADAVFATQEVVAKYLNDGDEVFMCLYDLCEAFDFSGIPNTADQAA